MAGWHWTRPHPSPGRILWAASPRPSCFACLCQKFGIGDSLTTEIQEKEIRKSTSGVCLCSLKHLNSWCQEGVRQSVGEEPKGIAPADGRAWSGGERALLAPVERSSGQGPQ